MPCTLNIAMTVDKQERKLPQTAGQKLARCQQLRTVLAHQVSQSGIAVNRHLRKGCFLPEQHTALPLDRGVSLSILD